MLLKIRFISNEVDDFLRDVEIDASSTFLDLHNFIQGNLGYEKGQMASFYTTDADWNKEQEITLLEMDDEPEEGLREMGSTKLDEFITTKKQRLLYVFDFLSERAFFIEVVDVDPDKSAKKPKVVKSSGEAPDQILMDDKDWDPDTDDNEDSWDDEDIVDKDIVDDFDDDFGGDDDWEESGSYREEYDY